jgi:uncharacterized protein (DUF305 family)
MSDKKGKRLAERAKKTQEAAHQRVVKDATVQFRLDQDSMEQLLKIADKQRTGVGVVCRNWVLDRLHNASSADEEIVQAVLEHHELLVQMAELKKEVAAIKKSMKLSRAG